MNQPWIYMCSPSRFPIPSLWVFPVQRPQALVSCIQLGLVICFTLDSILVSVLLSQNIKSIKKWFIVVMSNKRIQHFKTMIFKIFLVSSWGTHLPSFLTIPICFKCCGTVNVEFLASFPCSAKRVSFDDHLIGSLSLPMAGHCATHLQGCHLLCKTSWTTTALYVC